MLPIVINVLLVIHVLVSLLIILLVLMQRPKNEGLGAAFGGGATDQLFGAQTTNVLQTITRWLGGIFFALTLLLSFLYVKKGGGHSSLQDKLTAPTVIPAAPTPPAPPDLPGALPAADGTSQPPPPAGAEAAVEGASPIDGKGTNLKMEPTPTLPGGAFTNPVKVPGTPIPELEKIPTPAPGAAPVKPESAPSPTPAKPPEAQPPAPAPEPKPAEPAK